MTERLILLGCVAEYLYTSPLWRARRTYAERRAAGWDYPDWEGDKWAILSAHYGIVVPGTYIRRYDVTIRDRAADWSERVRDAFGRVDTDTVIEVHAGAPYVAALREAIGEYWTSEHPVQGLRIGEQLAWYAARAKEDNDKQEEE